MAFFDTIISIFIGKLTKEIRIVVQEEIRYLEKALLEAYAKGRAFDAIQDKGKDLKKELAQARTDDEYKAILRKTNNYLDTILNNHKL